MLRHRYDALRKIATPSEGMPGCATRDAYARQHVRQMQKKRALLPALGLRDPWPAPPGAVPFVVGGKWVVLCPCGDAPMASPEWDVARCFECGAIYAALAWPADRSAIEAALVVRPAAVRAWLPTETVADLLAQNAANGVG